MFIFSLLGESPPPPPRACFGREELIQSIVGLAENLDPIALTGAGGIGKTSIALTVLHHDRIKERLGEIGDTFAVTSSHLLPFFGKPKCNRGAVFRFFSPPEGSRARRQMPRVCYMTRTESILPLPQSRTRVAWVRSTPQTRPYQILDGPFPHPPLSSVLKY